MDDFNVKYVRIGELEYTDCFYTIDDKPGYTRLTYSVSEQAARISIINFRRTAINARDKVHG